MTVELYTQRKPGGKIKKQVIDTYPKGFRKYNTINVGKVYRAQLWWNGVMVLSVQNDKQATK